MSELERVRGGLSEILMLPIGDMLFFRETESLTVRDVERVGKGFTSPESVGV